MAKYYRMVQLAILVLGTAVVWAINPGYANSSPTALVYTLDGVRVIRVGEVVLVKAVGRTISLGWSKLHLEPRDPLQPVVNGFLELMFIAEPPGEREILLIDPVGASYRYLVTDTEIDGVRVRSAGNLYELRIDTPPTERHGLKIWCQGVLCSAELKSTDAAIKDMIEATMQRYSPTMASESARGCYPPCEQGDQCIKRCTGKQPPLTCAYTCVQSGPGGAYPPDPNPQPAPGSGHCMEFCSLGCIGLSGPLYSACLVACRAQCNHE